MVPPPAPAEVKAAVDDITRCVRDMEAVFANDAFFEDIEIPRKMLEKIARDHEHRVVVDVTVREEWRRRDEDDYYEYVISVPSANAIAYADMSPPTVYDPYESHDEDDDEDEKKVVRFEWRNQNVHFDGLFDGLMSLTFSTGTIFVWIKRDIPPSSRTELIEYLGAVGRQFERRPTFVCSMRHRSSVSNDGRAIVRRVNRALSALTV